ncbi:MFS transporter [Trujillonella endophytica]|uniref:Drug resistance transporter, EmrB/QacA subfamily n=1 Tax=Trujillonella endophytica TaxID=673521 RepID=A0A1H8VVI8_9ACTN|nr:MFS transporter [Trujillella endophytica]SEP19247.1 drug resistance transporter, EmrB/QacA subfamily [Trujillella endophytica]
MTPPGPDLAKAGPPGPTDGPDPKRWLALAVIAIAQLMIILDASIVNVALPAMQDDLNITEPNLQWVITAYTLAFGGLLLFGGRIADFMGRKRSFIIALIGFAFASGLGGIAPNAELLFAARALQGAFAALMAPAALSLLTVTFVDTKERARAFGVFGAISGGGAAIGLILGGVLTEYASWRWTLGVNVPIALLAAGLAVPLVKESRAEGDRHFDIPGVLLSALGLVSLVYGFTKAAEEGVGWGDPLTIALLVIAAVLLVAFVVRETRTEHPLLPMRVILDRTRGGSYLIFLLVGAGLFAMFLYLTLYFQRTLGYSPLEAGWAFLPFSGGVIVGAGVVSQLLPRVGPRPLMIVGLVLAAVGMLSLTRIGVESDYVTTVLPAMLLMSFGLASVFVPAASTALVGVEERDAGIASAVLNTAQQVGGSLGLAILTTIFSSTVTGWFEDNGARVATDPAFAATAEAEASVNGFEAAFYSAAGLFVLALIFAFWLIKAKKEDLPAEGAVAV